MELSYSQFSHLIRRFPDFELSYETISHNKVSNKYDICLAVPIGKKCYAWFTYDGNNNVCYLLDINRDKKISRAKKIPVMFDGDLSVGTVVYGTLWSEGRRPSTTNFVGGKATGEVWFIITSYITIILFNLFVVYSPYISNSIFRIIIIRR